MFFAFWFLVTITTNRHYIYTKLYSYWKYCNCTNCSISLVIINGSTDCGNHTNSLQHFHFHCYSLCSLAEEKFQLGYVVHIVLIFHICRCIFGGFWTLIVSKMRPSIDESIQIVFTVFLKLVVSVVWMKNWWELEHTTVDLIIFFCSLNEIGH